MGREITKTEAGKAESNQGRSRIRRLLESIRPQAKDAKKAQKTGKVKYPVEFTNWFIY